MGPYMPMSQKNVSVSDKYNVYMSYVRDSKAGGDDHYLVITQIAS
jgi:hypothetical protein